MGIRCYYPLPTRSTSTPQFTLHRTIICEKRNEMDGGEKSKLVVKFAHILPHSWRASSEFFILHFPLFFNFLFFELWVYVVHVRSILFVFVGNGLTSKHYYVIVLWLRFLLFISIEAFLLYTHNHKRTTCFRSLEFLSNSIRWFALQTTKSMRETSSCTSAYHTYTLKCFYFSNHRQQYSKANTMRLHTYTTPTTVDRLRVHTQWTQHISLLGTCRFSFLGFFRFHFRFSLSFSLGFGFYRQTNTPRESNRIGEKYTKSPCDHKVEEERVCRLCAQYSLTHTHTH